MSFELAFEPFDEIRGVTGTNATGTRLMHSVGPMLGPNLAKTLR